MMQLIMWVVFWYFCLGMAFAIIQKERILYTAELLFNGTLIKLPPSFGLKLCIRLVTLIYIIKWPEIMSKIKH